MANDLAPDWILKQALDAQRKANTAWVNSKPELDDGGLTLTVLGCGNIGTSILSGIFRHYQSESSLLQGPSRQSSPPSEPTPSRLPSKFNACVRSHESATRVKAELGKYNARLHIFENNNLGPVRAGDAILLCCKPQAVNDLLEADGMMNALRGKLLISVCAGLSELQLRDIVYGSCPNTDDECTIVRAMPNLASAVQESMTVISTSTLPVPAERRDLVSWIFTRIGKVMHLPAPNMDACTALCGSGPAFVALMVESLAAGAIAMGLPREAAYSLAAQTMRGTTAMLLQGASPTTVLDKVSTPSGCAVAGLQILEEDRLREMVAKAVKETSIVASQLGRNTAI